MTAGGIEVEGLQKTFYAPEPVRAVQGIHFRCEPGAVFGLLGPNGAGKTTTVSCVVGLLRPDSGRILIDGVDALARPTEAKFSASALLGSCRDALGHVVPPSLGTE